MPHLMLRNIIIGVTLGVLFGCAIGEVSARDDGRYATVDPETRAWFNKLASGKGLCCSFADGVSVDDPDVDMRDNHYFVRLDGKWIEVPDSALILEPNRMQRAIVWPYQDINGVTQIRCFIPGSGM